MQQVDQINLMIEVNMKLTVNDLKKMRNSAWDIYQRYQATMAGQLNDDIEELESKFNEIACEMGVDYSDLWEEFENDHSAKYGL